MESLTPCTHGCSPGRLTIALHPKKQNHVHAFINTYMHTPTKVAHTHTPGTCMWHAHVLVHPRVHIPTYVHAYIIVAHMLTRSHRYPHPVACLDHVKDKLMLQTKPLVLKAAEKANQNTLPPGVSTTPGRPPALNCTNQEFGHNRFMCVFTHHACAYIHSYVHTYLTHIHMHLCINQTHVQQSNRTRSL